MSESAIRNTSFSNVIVPQYISMYLKSCVQRYMHLFIIFHLFVINLGKALCKRHIDQFLSIFHLYCIVVTLSHKV